MSINYTFRFFNELSSLFFHSFLEAEDPACRARGGQWVIHQAEAGLKSEKGVVRVHPGGAGGEKIACAKNTRFPEAVEHKVGDGWWRTAESQTVMVYHVLVCEGMHLAVSRRLV